METVVKLSTSRNNQKVKNELVTAITKGMAKVIYDYLDRQQNEKSTPKSRNASIGIFFNRCGCFKTGRQFECQNKFSREAGSWDVALCLIPLLSMRSYQQGSRRRASSQEATASHGTVTCSSRVSKTPWSLDYTQQFNTDVGQRKLHHGISRLLPKKACAAPIKLFSQHKDTQRSSFPSINIK